MPTVIGRPDSAEKLAAFFIAGEIISALKVVRLNTTSDAFVADPTGTFEEAKAIGIARSAGGIGATIDVQTFGILEDASFTFSANTPLFLSATGSITDVAPVSGYNVQIGHGLGAGSIFIALREPILL